MKSLLLKITIFVLSSRLKRNVGKKVRKLKGYNTKKWKIAIDI